jgi:hypothetical protein
MLTRRSLLQGAAASAGLLTIGDGILRPAQAAVEDFIGKGNRLPGSDEIRASARDYWILVDMINEYRAGLRLPRVALSPKLTAVASLHVRDLHDNRPHETYGSMHSWSKSDRWRGGPFDRNDESTFSVMWDKPKDLFGYQGLGFEVAVKDARDAAHALETLKGSKLHNDVLLNRGIWADKRWQWKAMGAVFYKGFACAWFGDKPDAAS